MFTVMRSIVFSFIFLPLTFTANAQREINVWPGQAAGSENWNWREQMDSTEIPNDPLVYNVAQPVLVFYPADAAVANGTAVIICPGGGFVYLHIKTEGTDVARWLNKKGVSAFVLKYRLVHSDTDH